MIQLAGEPGQAGRRVSAQLRGHLSLAPDGSTPTALTARDDVQLFFPAGGRHGGAGPSTRRRSIAPATPGQGLTRAHFEGAVQYREQGPTVDRRAKSQALDASLESGHEFAIDEAKFARAVQFEDGTMAAPPRRRATYPG